MKQTKPLASGGQKWVFSAVHETRGPVALKLFHPGANLERAQREIDAIRLIASPRVPVVHENGVVHHNGADSLWIVEQWIEGECLRATINRALLAPQAVLKLGVQLLEVVAAAEAQRIVHRDIKPDNILIDTAGSDAWLLDFGIARHLDLDSLTATILPFGVGTLGYAPPEQFKNYKRDIDTRADLFAIGVTLYEAIEGANPYIAGAQHQAEVLRRMDQLALPAITRDIETSGGLRDLIFVITRPRVNHRIGTASEALAWMREIANRA